MPGLDLLRRPPGGDPVVIVGAGLAGLTAAYRLARAGIPSRIFEASQRLGGRIFTKDRFNAEGMFCELGGELIDSSHLEMLSLAGELGVPVDDFRPYDRGVEGHGFFFAGRRTYNQDLLERCGPLAAHLLRDMDAVFRGDLDEAITYRRPSEAARRFDRISLKEYLFSKTDVDRWLLEAIHVAYLGEYGLETEEQSCLNLFALINPEPDEFGIFGDSDEAMRIRGGNSRLIDALERAVRARVPLELGHRLASIRDAGSRLELEFATGGAPETVRAGQVILAIPFTTLRKVDGLDTLGLSPVKLKAIRELGCGSNAKMMLGFRERYWRAGAGGAMPPHSGYWFMDLSSQCFWDTSRAQEGASGIITNFLGGQAGVAGPAEGVETVLRDLDAVFPGMRPLYDGNHALLRWASMPFALGSYTCPRPGQYTTIVGSAEEPELGGRLLFCGEHASVGNQGYMNGAVETANAVAARVIRRRGLGLSALEPRPASRPVA